MGEPNIVTLRTSRARRAQFFMILPPDDPVIAIFPPISVYTVIPPLPREKTLELDFYVLRNGKAIYLYFPSLQCYTPKCSREFCPQDVRDTRFNALHMIVSGHKVRVRGKTIPLDTNAFYRGEFLCKDHKNPEPRRARSIEEMYATPSLYMEHRCHHGNCTYRATMTGRRCFRHREKGAVYLPQFRCEEPGCKHRYYKVYHAVGKQLCQKHGKIVDLQVYENRRPLDPVRDEIFNELSSLLDQSVGDINNVI